MSKPATGLAKQAREQLAKRFFGRQGSAGQPTRSAPVTDIPDAYTRFDRHPGYEKIMVPRAAAQRLGITNPYFKTHQGIGGALTQIDGRPYLNFASYNYLGLSGHPRVTKAAKDAIDRYGTSVSASRLVAGERPIQRELELALAEFYDTDDCAVFVSGHATNVTTIGYLFGPKDLVVHDSLIHNSVLEGIKLSGATRRAFAHNDAQALEAVLAEMRGQFQRVLIVIEGVYSMDGDFPDLPRFIDIKQRYQCFLMVDEAHSIGVMGATGRGLREHFNLPGNSVDIWMGTLSKSLAGCGGYIAGETALIDNLKYAAPGFVYSVGIAPPVAAAALEALHVMQAEPDRVERVQARSRYLLALLRERGIDTGHAQGYAVVPAITGSSLKATKLSNALFEQGVNVQPILYPAVEEKAARLRFFVSCLHTEQQLETVANLLANAI